MISINQVLLYFFFFQLLGCALAVCSTCYGNCGDPNHETKACPLTSRFSTNAAVLASAATATLGTAALTLDLGRAIPEFLGNP